MAHRTVGFGQLYQGRCKSFTVQSDEHLLTKARYVERNALGAGRRGAGHAATRRVRLRGDPPVPIASGNGSRYHAALCKCP